MLTHSEIISLATVINRYRIMYCYNYFLGQSIPEKSASLGMLEDFDN